MNNLPKNMSLWSKRLEHCLPNRRRRETYECDDIEKRNSTPLFATEIRYIFLKFKPGAIKAIRKVLGISAVNKEVDSPK
jgi:hypothetical protein